MKLTIHKGKHRPAWWWLSLRIWFNKKIITRIIQFDFTAKYSLGSEDNDDVNKLFGIGYLWNKKDSARFGWNWNQKTNKINLFAYYHVKGLRASKNSVGEKDFVKLCEIDWNINYELTLELHSDGYQFRITDARNGYNPGSIFIPHNHKKKWSYWLGPFFGGNRPAPHSITIQIKKK